MTPCQICPSLCASRTQIVAPSFCPQHGLLAIGEAPGQEEDQRGEGFIGRAGKTLDALLAAHGINRNDYGRANIVRCRPPENRKPTSNEIANCLPQLAQTLQAMKPRVLLLVGGTAADIFLGPGRLWDKIQDTQSSPILLARNARIELREAIRALYADTNGLLAIPMPHTSALAWNRKAPNGQRWSEIGAAQIALAVKFVKA